MPIPASHYQLSIWKKIIPEPEIGTFQESTLAKIDMLYDTHEFGVYFYDPPPKNHVHLIITVPGK